MHVSDSACSTFNARRNGWSCLSAKLGKVAGGLKWLPSVGWFGYALFGFKHVTSRFKTTITWWWTKKLVGHQFFDMAIPGICQNHWDHPCILCSNRDILRIGLHQTPQSIQRRHMSRKSQTHKLWSGSTIQTNHRIFRLHWPRDLYHLVMTNIAMENHHF